MHYLGRIILEEGICIDPKRIEAILNWPTPKNVTDLSSFMGLDGYYRRFIEGLSKVAHPTTYFQTKRVKFECTQECEEGFQLLNNILTNATFF